MKIAFLPRLLCLLVLALASTAVVAAPAVVYDFSSKFPTCSSGAWSQSGTTYTCSSGSMSLAAGDSIVPSSGITVVAEKGISLAGSNTIGSSSVAVNLQTAWGDIVASNSGNKTTTFYGNLTSGSGDINLTNALVHGYIDTLDHAILSGGSVTGYVSGRNGVTTSNGTLIGGNVTANAGQISLSGGSVTGSVHSDCCTITATNTNIGGNLSTTVISSNSNTVTIIGGTVSGAISTSGGSGILIKDATVTSGSISATGVAIEINNSTIGSSSNQVNVTGNNYVTISNKSTVWGNVTAGDWNSALSIDSSSIVYGICTSDKNSVTAPTKYPRCAGGSGTKVARFNACHNYSSLGGCPASSARLYTRQAGTEFTTDIVALKSDGTVDTSFTGKATISVIAKTSISTALDSQNCFAADATQTIDNAVSAFVAGRLTLSATVPTAYQDVRFKIVCDAKNCAPPGVTACSSDDFAIRPSRFSSVAATANADAAGASTSATPVFTAGGGFTLTATAGAGYNGTPKVKNNDKDSVSDSYVQAHSGAVTVGVVTASFDAADASTGQATASGASYSEVGYFRFGVDGVYDDSFAAVDRAKSDCTDDYVNTAGSGKIGCYFGNTAATDYFGRFIPHHFVVTPGTLLNRRLASCDPASDFTYAGEEMQLQNFKLTAYNALASPTITLNYSGPFAARFDGNTIANFNFGAVDLADTTVPVDATSFAVGDEPGKLGLVSSSGSWGAGSGGGIGTFSANVKLNRADSPDGPYESFRLGIAPVDSDGVTVIAADKNLDLTSPADGVFEKVLIGSTRVRFGRLRLDNVYGSELLPLTVRAWAEYWTSQEFATNKLDSCTSIASSRLGLGPYTGLLNKDNFGLDRLPAGPLTLDKGAGSVIMSSGTLTGSVFLGVNLSGTTTETTCAGPLLLGAAATSPDLSFLRGKWCGTSYGNDPRAKLTFGVYRSLRKLIHRREVF